ncbi:metallophosphoesterase [Candidatus Pacearchaeota archaeon]|nr:metallophosphoesterase [Candidatus Pacearchaeota archaeon]
MIIVVSDIHLGYNKSDTTSFKDFVYDYASKKLGSEDNFVLLGDIFDFWRRKNMDPLLENESVLTKILSMDTKVHYVVGNHDYYMLKIKERFPRYRALGLEKYLRLPDGKNKFFFIHGYELDVLANYEPLTLEEYERISETLCRAENILGRILSGLWGLKKKLKKPPEKRKSWNRQKGTEPSTTSHVDNLEAFACSKVRNFFLGLENDEKLVFGHTHNPFVDEDTGNTGSWIKKGPVYNTFIEIENGKMKLKKWEKKAIDLEIHSLMWHRRCKNSFSSLSQS